MPLYVGSDDLLEEVTGFHVHRGALAAMGRLPLPTVSELVPQCARVVVLEDVNSHTNLGAIFRCAAGLGMDAVLLSPSCADPLYRRSVRVSMGEVFAIPYARFEVWPTGLAELTTAGFTLLALTPDAARRHSGRSSYPGNEQAGVVARRRGPGPVGDRAGGCHPNGVHSDEQWRRLAERRGCDRGGVLRAARTKLTGAERNESHEYRDERERRPK